MPLSFLELLAPPPFHESENESKHQNLDLGERTCFFLAAASSSFVQVAFKQYSETNLR